MLRRTQRALEKAAMGTLGCAGAIALGFGIKMLSKEWSLIGLALIIAGSVFGTGGLLSVAILLYRDITARVKLSAGAAELTMISPSVIAPNSWDWYFAMEIKIHPPEGHRLVLQSDNIKAKLVSDNPLLHPLEMNAMGVCLASRAIKWDGGDCEMEIIRPTTVLCQGVCGTPPRPMTGNWHGAVTLSDPVEGWAQEVSVDLFRNGGKWSGFSERPEPVRSSDWRVWSEWIMFLFLCTIMIGVVAWAGWCILVRGWL